MDVPSSLPNVTDATSAVRPTLLADRAAPSSQGNGQVHLADGAPSTSGHARIFPTPAVTRAPDAAAVPVARADGTAVVAQFQEVMSRFLETQRAVMLAYLNGAPGTVTTSGYTRAVPVTPVQAASAPVGVGAPVVTIPTPTAAPAAPAVTRPPMPAETVALPAAETEASPAVTPPQIAAPASVPAAPALTREAVIAQLLAIVAERTGYPPEMLGLGAPAHCSLRSIGVR